MRTGQVGLAGQLPKISPDLVPAAKAFLRELGVQNKSDLAKVSATAVQAGRFDWGGPKLEPLLRKLVPFFRQILKAEGNPNWNLPELSPKTADGIMYPVSADTAATAPPKPVDKAADKAAGIAGLSGRAERQYPKYPAGAPGRGPSGSEFYVGAWQDSWGASGEEAVGATGVDEGGTKYPNQDPPGKAPMGKRAGAYVWQPLMASKSGSNGGGWLWQDALNPSMSIVTSPDGFGKLSGAGCQSRKELEKGITVTRFGCWLKVPSGFPPGLAVPVGKEPRWEISNFPADPPGVTVGPEGPGGKIWYAYAYFSSDGKTLDVPPVGMGSGFIWTVKLQVISQEPEERKKRSEYEAGGRDQITKTFGRALGSGVLGILVSALLSILGLVEKEGGDPAGILILLLGVISLGVYTRLKKNLQSTASGTALAKW